MFHSIFVISFFSDVLIPVGVCMLLGLVTAMLMGGLQWIGLGVILRPVIRLLYPRERDLYEQTVLLNYLWFRIGLVYTVFYGLIESGLFDWVFWGAVAYGIYRLWRYIQGRQSAPVEPDGEALPGFTLATQNGPIQVANPYRGVFVAGGAGSGKSKSIIEPIIHQAGAQGMAGIVYDFKFPTLAQEVAGSYQGSPVTPYFINFTDLSRSHRINPIRAELLTSASFARDAAVTVLANLDYQASQARSFWIQSAEVLLTGAIWYLRQRHPEQCSLPHAVSLLLAGSPTDLIRTLSQDEQTRGIIASVSSGAGSENQLAGVFATIQNYLSVLNSPEIFWILSGDDVPLDLNSPEKPGMLVLGNDPTLSSTFSPLLSLIVSTALKRMNQRGRIPSVVILDEAPTLFIPNFQQIPATARDNKVATVYAVQDIAQMEGTLGASVAEMIISNLSNQFFGRTTNPKTAERVSKLFGKYDQAFEGRSMSHGDRTSYGRSENVQQRDRLEASVVMRFQPGEFAGLIAEGNVTEFRRVFVADESRAQPIRSFTAVNTNELQANYLAVQAQAQVILQVKHMDNPVDQSTQSITHPDGLTLEDLL
ncbi:type IV secretory system conjugative DNA transfer family protein [Larkinella bovis]|uniref:Type IV secretory system conjugative DNA transfer family protein n=1 Tax=Larkinella bovis TaxID=683041 RepID=A0ABW0II55_9BACT